MPLSSEPSTSSAMPWPGNESTGSDHAVRIATNADAAGIAAAHVGAWRAAYRDILSPSHLAELSVQRYTAGWTRLLDEPGDMTVLVVVDEPGGVVGFATTCPSRDDDAPATTGELAAIYLHPSFWGRGAGSHLHDEAVALLGRQHAEATLWVLERNRRTRRFYEHKGWMGDSGTTRTDTIGGREVTEVRYRRVLVE